MSSQPVSDPKWGATVETEVPFPIILPERPSSRKSTPSKATGGSESISFLAPQGSHSAQAWVGCSGRAWEMGRGGQWEST